MRKPQRKTKRQAAKVKPQGCADEINEHSRITPCGDTSYISLKKNVQSVFFPFSSFSWSREQENNEKNGSGKTVNGWSSTEKNGKKTVKENGKTAKKHKVENKQNSPGLWPNGVLR